MNLKLSDILLNADTTTLIDHIIELEKEDFSNDDLMPIITQNINNDIKCWALLKLKQIRDANDVRIIIQLLKSDDSRIRELASEIIFKHTDTNNKESNNLFDLEDYYDNYIETLKDINPRVTRNITACFACLTNKNLIFEKITFALNNYEGPYLQYWSFEGICQIIEKLSKDIVIAKLEYLLPVINKVIVSKDELLKEKVAIILGYILPYINLDDYNTLKNNINKLKNDKNFYVQKVAQNLH